MFLIQPTTQLQTPAILSFQIENGKFINLSDKKQYKTIKRSFLRQFLSFYLLYFMVLYRFKMDLSYRLYRALIKISLLTVQNDKGHLLTSIGVCTAEWKLLMGHPSRPCIKISLAKGTLHPKSFFSIFQLFLITVI